MKVSSRQVLHPATHALRAGFTLLEMMVVIGIIGLLAAFLVPNIMQAMGQATVTAEQANMRELYTWLTMYKTNNDNGWPTATGQKFILQLWKSGTVERSEMRMRLRVS